MKHYQINLTDKPARRTAEYLQSNGYTYVGYSIQDGTVYEQYQDQDSDTLITLAITL